MSKTMHVWPVEGRVIFDPQSGRPIPATGLEVLCSTFWFRRLRKGDVTNKQPEQTEQPIEPPVGDEAAHPGAEVETAPEEVPVVDTPAAEPVAEAAVEVPVTVEARPPKKPKKPTRGADGKFGAAS